MRAAETITDPNVAAFLIVHGAMRLVVEHGEDPAPYRHWWGRLGAGVWHSISTAIDPPLEACRRENTTLYSSPAFAAKVNIQVKMLRAQASGALPRGNAVRAGSRAD